MFHAGRDPVHRSRERALAAAGVDLTLILPSAWPEVDGVTPEPFEVAQLPVRRAGDVNRHTYADRGALAAVVARVRPDLVDLQEEPFSSVVRQALSVVPAGVPVVTYTAQNLDKRWPPPFAQWETRAFQRLAGIYPCSRQAASVVRGKGYAGLVTPLPLGIDPAAFAPGEQSLDEPVLVLGLIGRLLPRKGVLDAVRVLAAVQRVRPARLLLVGRGPDEDPARVLAAELGVGDRLEVHPWLGAASLGASYRRMHVVLVPSTATRTWVEQFGRTVVEGRACGAVVVAYASGSLPEVVGDSGVLVAEGDAKALSSAVVTLVGDAPRWEQLRAAGLAGASELAWPELARRQLAFYDAAFTGAARVPAGREAAVREFGEPALIRGGGRPFALPVLREDTALSRAAATGVDVGSAAARRLRGRS